MNRFFGWMGTGTGWGAIAARSALFVPAILAIAVVSAPVFAVVWPAFAAPSAPLVAGLAGAALAWKFPAIANVIHELWEREGETSERTPELEPQATTPDVTVHITPGVRKMEVEGEPIVVDAPIQITYLQSGINISGTDSSGDFVFISGTTSDGSITNTKRYVVNPNDITLDGDAQTAVFTADDGKRYAMDLRGFQNDSGNNPTFEQFRTLVKEQKEKVAEVTGPEA